MDRILGALKIEAWYHVFVVLGAVGAIAALAVELKGVANAHVLLISLGTFLIGIGEWINHPLQTGILPPNAYLAPGGAIVSGHPRKPSVLGSLFDVLGFTLLVVGLWKVVAAS